MARLFSSYSQHKDVCILAAGVSHSKTTDVGQFERERLVVLQAIHQCPETLFVYFSTCSLYDPSEQHSPYCTHKLQMENLIRERCPRYCIVRISQAVGQSGNTSTLLNFLVHAVYYNHHFELWTESWRNLIGIDEIFPLVEYCINHKNFHNSVVNIANPFMVTVRELVTAVEQFTGKKASYTPVIKGALYAIDVESIKPIIQSLQLPFGEHYNHVLLQRYYSSFAQ